MGLAGECGEFCNKVKKIARDDNNILTEERKKQLVDELGDILWYVALCAYELKVNLGEVALRNEIKLAERSIRNKINGAGDNR
ncbi:MAG: hypothetical protein LLG06_00685 [Desulfobacteraceae bacterium]|nr:hypothetical protein [Desulfobacteraceae bacterium]